MKISVSEEKKSVEDQRRTLEDQIADFQRRKAQYEAEKMNTGHHTLTLGKLGKKKWEDFFTFCQQNRFFAFSIDRKLNDNLL